MDYTQAARMLVAPSLRSFTDVVFPYPTLSEISKWVASTRWLMRGIQESG